MQVWVSCLGLQLSLSCGTFHACGSTASMEATPGCGTGCNPETVPPYPGTAASSEAGGVSLPIHQ